MEGNDMNDFNLENEIQRIDDKITAARGSNGALSRYALMGCYNKYALMKILEDTFTEECAVYCHRGVVYVQTNMPLRDLLFFFADLTGWCHGDALMVREWSDMKYVFAFETRKLISVSEIPTS